MLMKTAGRKDVYIAACIQSKPFRLDKREQKPICSAIFVGYCLLGADYITNLSPLAGQKLLLGS